MGINDLQIGLIFGLKKTAVSKIKQWWFPQWGFAGKLLTDLELYEDYVNLERPDAYYANQLLRRHGYLPNVMEFFSHPEFSSFKRNEPRTTA